MSPGGGEGGFDAEGPLRPRGAPAARARPAASLVLVRRASDGPRILLGRRSGGHDFMPGKWVFPGGRVDRSDGRAPAAAELRPEVEALVRAEGSASRRAPRPRALALAALRETLEETGLALGRPLDGYRPPRGFAAFGRAGLAPDLSGLEYLGRAVTPSVRPKRFDAAFFLADGGLAAATDLEPSGELHPLDWFSPTEALGLDLPSVTRRLIQEVAARLVLEDDPRRARPPPLRLLPGRRRTDRRGPDA